MMLGDVEPDFRIMFDFRKDNIDGLKIFFYEFHKRLFGAAGWGVTSM